MIHHVEGLAIGAGSIMAYFLMHESGRLLAMLILAPDLGMLGYLIKPKLGSLTYNLLHTYLWPIILGFLGVTMGYPTVPVALIWAAHIGFDRALGFGLKYPTNFKDTDIGRV